MATDDDTFIALGPSPAGFFCYSADLLAGGYMTGIWYGLWAQGLDRGPQDFLSQFNSVGSVGTVQDGAGVVGTTGNHFGVFGQAGEAAHAGGAPAGVCGTSLQQIGVLGLSSANYGMFGFSDRFIGVHGTSNESIGVRGERLGPGPAFGGGDAITPACVVGTSVPSRTLSGHRRNRSALPANREKAD
jgi:hypothetical protein